MTFKAIASEPKRRTKQAVLRVMHPLSSQKFLEETGSSPASAPIGGQPVSGPAVTHFGLTEACASGAGAWGPRAQPWRQATG